MNDGVGEDEASGHTGKGGEDVHVLGSGHLELAPLSLFIVLTSILHRSVSLKINRFFQPEIVTFRKY